MTPTSRTLQHLKAAGVPYQKVERFCTYSRRRIDLFGVIDIVAIRDGKIVGIQVTGGAGNASARCKKAEAEPRLREWLAAVRESLVELLKLPESVRVPYGVGGDDDPAKFPPPPGMVMVDASELMQRS